MFQLIQIKWEIQVTGKHRKKREKRKMISDFLCRLGV